MGSNKCTLKIKFSKGFGNNLFQYCFGRLLSEYHNLNYSHGSIKEMGIKEEKYSFNKSFPIVKFKANSNEEAKKFDEDHLKWFSDKYRNYNFNFFSFMFYFEDYRIYKPHCEKIRLWFPLIKKNNTKDLVVHFRLKNRLVWETHYNNFIKPEIYKKTISSNFSFDKLYIVSDMDKWDYYKMSDIEDIKNETLKKYKGNSTNFISSKKSLEYINNLVDSLKEFNPILYHKEEFIQDFNFIRSFDQILFKDSTFSWWASFLSNASKIGVFGPWKPNKKKRNKNLGKMDMNGWFSWGSEEDIIGKNL